MRGPGFHIPVWSPGDKLPGVAPNYKSLGDICVGMSFGVILESSRLILVYYFKIGLILANFCVCEFLIILYSCGSTGVESVLSSHHGDQELNKGSEA